MMRLHRVIAKCAQRRYFELRAPSTVAMIAPRLRGRFGERPAPSPAGFRMTKVEVRSPSMRRLNLLGHPISFPDSSDVSDGFKIIGVPTSRQNKFQVKQISQISPCL